jgi:hypothetical protein
VVEKDQWADHAPLRIGQHAPNLEPSEIPAALLNKQFDHDGGFMICHA